MFSHPRAPCLVDNVVEEVCGREKYRLLESNLSDDHLRLLVSLRPEHTVSATVKMLKGNLQHRFRKELEIEGLWAKGYFARSSGTVDLERARNYVDRQVKHHGFSGDWTKPLKYSNPSFTSPAFQHGHNISILKYHLVFVTQERLALFDEAIALKLFDCISAVGSKRQFAVDRIGLLPDHMHVLIEGVPTVSPQEYALAIVNNTQHWMERKFSGVLKETGAWNVWQPSYYVGTVGEYTTAQIDRFVRG